VNSLHHQAIADPGSGVAVEGRAPDGVIEAVSVSGARFALGVQWHPEMMHYADSVQRRPFEALVTTAKPTVVALS
jgi:gamma-glutamyl-gamma-aminobutyrate hydrolase PuuD